MSGGIDHADALDLLLNFDRSLEHLDRGDQRYDFLTTNRAYGNVRARSLEKLHSEQVAQFIAREGFGVHA